MWKRLKTQTGHSHVMDTDRSCHVTDTDRSQSRHGHRQVTVTSWTQTGHVMSRTHRQVMSCHGHRQVTVRSRTHTYVMVRSRTHRQVTDTDSSLPSHIWYFTDFKNTTSLLLFLPYMIFCLTLRLDRHAYAQRPFEK